MVHTPCSSSEMSQGLLLCMFVLHLEEKRQEGSENLDCEADWRKWITVEGVSKCYPQIQEFHKLSPLGLCHVRSLCYILRKP